MKSTKVLRAALAVLFAAVLMTGCGGEGSYESFSLAMDKLAGEGKWSDKGHSTSFFGGDLTVTGLTVTGENSDLEVAELKLAKPLEKEKLKAILDAPDWKDRKEAELAKGLVLKGLKRTVKQGENIVLTTTADEVNFTIIRLAAADSNAASGPAGFLQALRIGKVGYANLKGLSNGEKSDLEMTLARLEAEALAFDAAPLPGLDALDPSGLASAVSSFSAKNMTFKDMSFTINRLEGAPEGPGKMTFALASWDQKDLKGFRSAANWTIAGLKFVLEGEPQNMNFALDSLILNDLDMTEYLDKIMPIALAAASEGSDPYNATSGLQTFADFFVSPFSLKDASMKGLDFTVGKVIGLKMAECLWTGPLTAGAIASKQASAVTGLEIILPDSPEGLDDDALELYQFGQDFGQSRFVIDAVSESSYDAAAARLTSDLKKFAVKDLFDLSFTMNMGGLTSERLNAMKATKLDNILMVLMDPESVFGDMSLENLNLNIQNQGLAERIYAYAGKTRLNGASADEVKNMAVGFVSLGMAAQGSVYMENPDTLTNSVTTFLKEPKNLKLSIKPEPALSFAAAKAFAGDRNALLNSLNLTLSANDESGAAPLRFHLPLAPADLSQMSDEELEEYLADEEAAAPEGE